MRRVAERALYHEHVLARLDFPAANAQQHVVHPVEAVADGQLGQAGLHAGAAFVRRPPKLAVESVPAGGAALVERVAGVGGGGWVPGVRLARNRSGTLNSRRTPAILLRVRTVNRGPHSR